MADKEKETDASVSTFVSSIIFTAAVSLALFLVFAILRTRVPRVYAPKTYMGPERERPGSALGGILGWILGGRQLSDREVVDHCGLDAYMFLDFLNKAFFLFLGFSILAIPILIPLNSFRQLSLVGLNQLTIANIADQKRLWGHLLLTVLFCVATLALGILSVRKYITRRQEYLLSPQHAQSLQATTILVCGIPPGQDNVQDLHSIFNRFPGGVRHIWLAYGATELEKDCTKRTALTNKLETAECALIRAKLKNHVQNGRRASEASANSTDLLRNRPATYAHPTLDESFPSQDRPQHRPAAFPLSLFSCCGPEKVDSIIAYRSELSNMNASMLARQQAGMAAMHESASQDRMNSAFIQFNHQMGAHLATQSVVHRKTLTMSPRLLEVHPKDVLWDNLGYSLKKRNLRKALAFILATALIILWAIPVAFVASVAKLDAIVKFAPFLKGVYSLPKVVVGIIQGILPPVGLAILMMVLPMILYKLAHLGGEVLSTRKTLQVITSFHWFSVVHVLLVTTLANGIFAAVQEIKDNPSKVMSMLASTLPQASTFFLSFILLSFIQIPLMLLQIGPLIMYFVAKKRAATPRQMFAAERTMGSVDWGTTIPVHTIAFSIGLLYSTIQPIILPLMVIYFGLYYLAFRYMFLHVYRQPFDSGGLIYPRIIDQVYVAVIIFELVMLGLFVLQKAIGQAVIMFILLVGSIAAIHMSRSKVFKPLIQYLPIEAFARNGLEGGNGRPMVQGDRVNPIPAQESFHEKAPYMDPLSPRLEPRTTELYSPDVSKPMSLRNSGSPHSQHSDQSPLPSIRVENTVGESSDGRGDTEDEIVPHSQSSQPASNHPDRQASLGSQLSQKSGHPGPLAGARQQAPARQDSEYGSLQVLGANQSVLSSTNPAAERMVPDTYAFVNPALWRTGQPIWLPKDPRGFAELETLELGNAGLPSTTDSAVMDVKGAITVETTHDVAPGDDYWG